jgi:Ca2+-binding RTX toxin-like protein
VQPAQGHESLVYCEGVAGGHGDHLGGETFPRSDNEYGSPATDVYSGLLYGDFIYGSNRDDADIDRGDIFCGNEGWDEIFGYGGWDRLYGHDGNDILQGGKGGDTIIGATGADNIFGGGGPDTLRGEVGNDEIGGGDGDDDITDTSGDDTDIICDGNGFDSIDVRDGDGRDTVYLVTDGIGGEPLSRNSGDQVIVGSCPNQTG